MAHWTFIGFAFLFFIATLTSIQVIWNWNINSLVITTQKLWYLGTNSSQNIEFTFLHEAMFHKIMQRKILFPYSSIQTENKITFFWIPIFKDKQGNMYIAQHVCNYINPQWSSLGFLHHVAIKCFDYMTKYQTLNHQTV
jgi:hypothetical protein